MILLFHFLCKEYTFIIHLLFFFLFFFNSNMGRGKRGITTLIKYKKGGQSKPQSQINKKTRLKQSNKITNGNWSNTSPGPKEKPMRPKKAASKGKTKSTRKDKPFRILASTTEPTPQKAKTESLMNDHTTVNKTGKQELEGKVSTQKRNSNKAWRQNPTKENTKIQRNNIKTVKHAVENQNTVTQR
jgi:hypothetical protein